MISKELMQIMWKEAKKYLPGDIYAVLYQGQQQNVKNNFSELSIFEKIALQNLKIDNLEKLTDNELRKSWKYLIQIFSNISKDKDGYNDCLNSAIVFEQEFKKRGLLLGNWKIINANKNEIIDIYDLEDIVNWLDNDSCKVLYNKSEFCDIDSIEKLKYAIYTAFSEKAPFILIEKENDEKCMKYYFDYGLKVKAFTSSTFGIEDRFLGKSISTLNPESIYNIQPSFVLNADDVEKNYFVDSNIVEDNDNIVITDNIQDFINNYRCVQKLKDEVDLLPFFGSPKSGVVFLGLSPDEIEKNSEQFFTNKAQEIFKSKYLEPLGLTMNEVLLGNLVPIPVFDDAGKRRKPVQKEIDAWRFLQQLHIKDDMCVIALGKSTEKALNGRANFVLPHPKTIIYKGNSGEVARKLRKIKKYIDKNNKFDILIDRNQGSSDPELADATISSSNDGAKASLTVQIQKADEEKQIVYGIVSDPYGKSGPEFDAHKDWIPPKYVEQMSHNFMQNFRKINIQHKKDSKSIPVESYIEQYPSKSDYKKAMNNEPHSIYRRKFGNDVVHSGSWVMATKLTDQDWADYKSGKLNAYSIEGTGLRIPMQQSEMPQVTIIDLEPKT